MCGICIPAAAGRFLCFTGAQYQAEAANLATAAPTCARLPLFGRTPTNKALLSLACPAIAPLPPAGRWPSALARYRLRDKASLSLALVVCFQFQPPALASSALHVGNGFL